MPASVTEAGARLADEVGFDQLSMSPIARRLGVKTPSLYKHVDSLADLAYRIAVLAATELGDAIRDGTQGRSDSDALAAAAQTIRTYVREHPGRYTALNSAHLTGPDDPLTAARARLLDSFAAVLRGYRLDPSEEIHALRMLRSMLHGFASLEVAGEFHLETEVDQSFAWTIAFIDRGLRATATPPPSATPPRTRPAGTRPRR